MEVEAPAAVRERTPDRPSSAEQRRREEEEQFQAKFVSMFEEWPGERCENGEGVGG